jgi:hypothetical protein
MVLPLTVHPRMAVDAPTLADAPKHTRIFGTTLIFSAHTHKMGLALN